MIVVQWEHVVKHCHELLTPLRQKLVNIDPNNKCAVAACQAAIRTLEDVLEIPAQLSRKVADTHVEAQGHS